MLSLTHERRLGWFPVLHDGLCQFWPFTSRSNPRYPRETVGGARPSSAVTTPIRDQWGEGALRFNGTTDELVYQDSPRMRGPDTAITMYARVRFASLPVHALGHPVSVLDKDWGGAVADSYGIEVTDEFATVWMYNGTSVTSGSAMPPGGTILSRWISIFGRWTAGGPVYVEAYYDGGQVAVARNSGANVTGPLIYDTGSMFIGRTAGGTRSAMDCSQIAVWDRSLSNAELGLLVTDPGLLARSTLLPHGHVAGPGPLTMLSSVRMRPSAGGGI